MTTDGKDQDKTPLGQGEDTPQAKGGSKKPGAEAENSVRKTQKDKVAGDADTQGGEGKKTGQDKTDQGDDGHDKSGESPVKKGGKSPQAAGKKSTGKSGSKGGKNIAIPQAKSGSAAGGKGGQSEKVTASSAKIGEYQPRQISLVVSRIDPWTVMKVSFLLSVALGIAMVLAGLLVWLLLNSMNVFSSVENFINDIDPTGSIASMIDYLRLPRMMAMSTIIAVSNVILMTAFCTVGALIYNLATSLVGGIKLALTDE